MLPWVDVTEIWAATVNNTAADIRRHAEMFEVGAALLARARQSGVVVADVFVKSSEDRSSLTRTLDDVD